MRSYAVVWSDDGSTPCAGRLVVSESGLELHGVGENGRTSVAFVEAGAVANARAASGSGERLKDCPTIVLERRDGTTVRIGALEFAIVREVLDRVAALRADAAAHARALIVVPLQKGTAEQARELIAQGPPFDPAAVGLTRHEVFVGDESALFVLDAPRIDQVVERLLQDISVWRGAVAWSSCLAGPPMLATLSYSWSEDGQDQ